MIHLALALAIACSLAAEPMVGKAEPIPAWNAKFAGLEGWIGGDAVYSVVLSPKRTLWLFGDTLIGTVKDGKRTGAVMVNNTVGVQTGDAIEFVTGQGQDRKPASLLVPSEGTGWFWPFGSVRVGERLFLFLGRIEKTKDPGAFGFRQTGEVLAIVENPEDAPRQWRMKQLALPFGDFTPAGPRAFSSAVLVEGDFAYVYGYLERGKGFDRRQLLVARAPLNKLDDFSTWRFRTADGWSEKASDAVPLANAMATEFSVSKLPGGKYVLVTTECGLGNRIVARFADAPEGPWSAATLLYTCPEGQDRGLFCYSAKAHPQLATGDELVISYCVNANDFSRLFRDETVYRPRFIRVPVVAGK